MYVHLKVLVFYICGSQELKTQIISEVKDEKMAIEDDVQMRELRQEHVLALHIIV